jgi:hypothetical protein
MCDFILTRLGGYIIIVLLFFGDEYSAIVFWHSTYLVI